MEMPDAFMQWVKREMPPGTVINSPEWWASKLWTAARRDVLDEVDRHFREAAAGTPLGHEDHQRGASTYNWLIYCATTISAMNGRAAAGEGKP